MFNKALYFLIQCLLTLVSPILSFLLSLRFYKSEISQLFFVVFAFYFGYFCHFFYDESVHYREFMFFYVDYNLSEILTNPLVFLHGHDYFHVFVKYIISRFTTSHNVFGGVFCAIHAGMFIFFYRQLKRFYLKDLAKASLLILAILSVVYEFWWYSTLRFNSAAFFFTGFYLKSINNKNPLYLLIAALSPLIHYTFLIIDGALVIELLFRYIFKHRFFRYVFFGLSLVVRSMKIDFVPFLLKRISWMQENMSYAVTNEDTRANVLNLQEKIRTSGNWAYNVRPYLLLFLGLGILYLFKRWKLPTDKQYIALFHFFITLFALANFGYGDMTFYDRVFQLSLLFLWSYVFIASVQYFSKTRRGNMLIFVLLILPAIFFVLSPFVQYRNSVFNPELIFGNFFMDWDGNNYDVGYAVQSSKRH